MTRARFRSPRVQPTCPKLRTSRTGCASWEIPARRRFDRGPAPGSMVFSRVWDAWRLHKIPRNSAGKWPKGQEIPQVAGSFPSLSSGGKLRADGHAPADWYPLQSPLESRSPCFIDRTVDRLAGNSCAIFSGGSISQFERHRSSLDHAINRIDHKSTERHFSLCQQWPDPLQQIIRHINGRSHMLLHNA